MDDAFEARLVALEAREQVRATIADYCRQTDALSGVAGLIGLFAEDAVLVNPSGEYTGRDAIEAYYGAFFDGTTEFARHHTMNQVIDILEPGLARHRSYFLAFLGRAGDSRLVFGEYDDLLALTPDGWRFTRKVNQIVGSATPTSGWAHGFGQ